MLKTDFFSLPRAAFTFNAMFRQGCHYSPKSIHWAINVTVHEKTRCKSKIAALDNAHLKVQTLCYFMLKSVWPNGDKITSV